MSDETLTERHIDSLMCQAASRDECDNPTHWTATVEGVHVRRCNAGCDETGHALLGDPAQTPVGDVEGLAKALGDIRIEGARQADWWTDDTEHSLLIQVLRGECVPWAEGLLASDWLAGFAAAQRAEALQEAATALPGFDSIRTHGDAAQWLRARADREGRP